MGSGGWGGGRGAQAGGAESDESSAPPPPPAGPALCLPLRRPDDLSREGSESRGPGPSPAPPLLRPGPAAVAGPRARPPSPPLPRRTQGPARPRLLRVSAARGRGRGRAGLCGGARPGACKQAGRLPGRSREETRQLHPLGGLLTESAPGGEGLTRGGGGGGVCAAAGKGRDPRPGGADTSGRRTFGFGEPAAGSPLEQTSR